MNKYIINFIAIALVASIWLTYKEFKYEQELSVQHTYLQACEAETLYLNFIVEKAGIEVI